MTDRTLPLSRFTVLDFSRIRAGPTAVRQLADWGADVIKIEMPLDKLEEEPFVGPRDAGDFQNLHRNKRSLTLDLKAPGAKEILRRLVRRADVAVENFRPDVKQRLGLDYEALSAINPRIVLGSISGYGQDGPYASRPGVDQIAQGMGGLMSVTGLPGQGPVRAGTAVADSSAGLYLAIGILTALIEREVSGRGQWVHTSLLEAQIGIMDFQAAAWLFDRTVPEQAGNNHPKAIPTGTFATADGHINIAAGSQERWRQLCAVIGHPALADRAGFATADDRRSNRDDVNSALGAIFRTKTSAAWVTALNGAGIPCGPIYRVDEVFADPQVRHVGIAASVEHPKLGPRQLVGQPVHLSRTPWRMQFAAPEAGEHTDAILTEIGFDAAAIAELKRNKVV